IYLNLLITVCGVSFSLNQSLSNKRYQARKFLEKPKQFRAFACRPANCRHPVSGAIFSLSPDIL
ncbi:MAG: hypothetical protein WCF85_18445, partial [Rhodospirillaceae bacterium]